MLDTWQHGAEPIILSTLASQETILSFCDILPLLGLQPSRHHVLWKRKSSARKVKYLEMGSLEIFSCKNSILSGKQNYRFIIKAGFGVPGHRNPPRCGAK